jgi:chromosome segregation ATPase
MTARRAILLGLVGLIASATSIDALARRGRRVNFSGRGLPSGARVSGPVLRRDELRRCVAQEESINAKSVEVDRLQSDLEVKKRELDALERRISSAEPLVDTSSQASVDQFNALVNEHRRLVEQFNAGLAPVNESIDQLNAEVDRFNSACADRPYYESDMTAVRSGR